jgi:hypothetical protein
MPEVSTLSHLTNSAFVVYLLQYLKGTKTYQRFAQSLPIETSRVHVLMSALGAAGTSLGMHGAVTGTYLAGWQLTLAIPPLWIVLHAGWDWAQQMALNQLVFALAVQKKQAAPVVTVPVPAVAPGVTVTAPVEVKSAKGE